MPADQCDLLCLHLDKAERLRAGLLSAEAADGIARIGKALGDPTRLTVAAALAATDELCVCDLSWIVGRAENLVSHHLRLLRAEGLVASRREGKMVMYSMTDSGRAGFEALAAGRLAA
jgi:ArsR family transcriptional regulator, lead/cadmium/zinc/bismuth-responsive transcriptional repressor